MIRVPPESDLLPHQLGSAGLVDTILLERSTCSSKRVRYFFKCAEIGASLEPVIGVPVLTLRSLGQVWEICITEALSQAQVASRRVKPDSSYVLLPITVESFYFTAEPFFSISFS